MSTIKLIAAFVSVAVISIVVLMSTPGKASQKGLASTQNAPASSVFPNIGQQIYAIGRVEPNSKEIALATELSGKVGAVHVVEGQFVEIGDPLIQLDDRELRANCQIAVAERDIKAAELIRIKNGPTAHERDEANALIAKTAQLDHIHVSANRIQKLANANVVASQEADDYEARRNQFSAERAAAKARVDQLNSQPRADEVNIAAARLEAAQARVALAFLHYERSFLKSPIRGQILSLDVAVGEVVGPQEKAVLTLADVSARRVRAFVEELDAPRVTLGMQATVTADGVPEKQVQGQVVRMSPKMTAKSIWNDHPSERHDTKTREVWIDLVEQADWLVFGLRVDVSLAPCKVSKQ